MRTNESSDQWIYNANKNIFAKISNLEVRLDSECASGHSLLDLIKACSKNPC